jgi:superfamily II DNA or RNA helicase
MSSALENIRYAPADVVRSLIAHASLASAEAPACVGSIRLWEHQRDAVVRIREALGEFGGALLADEVGLGKTYVALAVAATYRRSIVITPAALRDTWARAMAAAGVRAPWMSLEALSRGIPDVCFDLVIVDEAHHARNADTKRYRALAALSASAAVLLLSATPIHNTQRDLSSLLALFLGSHVDALDSSALSRIIVRRTRNSAHSLHGAPNVRPTISVASSDDVHVAERILALPPPVPPRDGGVANALVCFSLLRQWSSSTGALRSALRRRIGRTRALIDALREGRLPSGADIDAWVVGDDAQQLALAGLLVPAVSSLCQGPDIALLLDGAMRHECALVALVESLGARADVARAEALRRILSAHPSERVLAFSQFAETIGAYWRLLRDIPGVCALTATGGLVAGGRISRAEAIARFAPIANGAPPPSAAEEIRVLLTTDLLSEGINLQDASVVVHLDFPWTPARVEQRVGRVARSGSAHTSIAVYAMQPPASGEAVVDIQRRLSEKLAVAMRSVGASSVALFGAKVTEVVSPPQATEALRAILRRWLSSGTSLPAVDRACVHCVAVRARERGWLAVVQSPRGARLVASLGDRTGTECTLVLTVARLCDGAPGVEAGDSTGAIDDSVRELDHWLSEQRAATLAGVTEIEVFRGRRPALRRLAGLESLPRTRRMVLDPLSRAARSVATGRMSRGAEQRLSDLVEMDHEPWLERLGRLSGRSHDGASTVGGSVESVVALLALAPE